MRILLISPTHYNADGALHKTTRYWTSGTTSCESFDGGLTKMWVPNSMCNWTNMQWISNPLFKISLPSYMKKITGSP